MTDAEPTDLSMSRFAAVKASDFTISALMPDGAGGGEIIARLQRLTSFDVAREFEQYSMLFIGPVQPLLPQGTYLFTHATLGKLSLFMVPVGQDAQGTQYEVCVSRKVARTDAEPA